MKKKFMKIMRTSMLALGVVAFLVSSCSDYDDDITNLQGQIDGKASLEEVTTAVGDLKTELEVKITAATTEAATALAKAQEALTELDGKLTAADLEEIKGNITDITAELDALPEGLGDIDFDALDGLVGQLDDLQTQVDGLNLGLDSDAVIVLINTQLTETKSTLSTLGTTVEGLSAKVIDLEAKLEGISATDLEELKEMMAEITELKDQVAKLSDKLKTLAFIPDAIDNGLGAIKFYALYGYSVKSLNDNANPIFAATNKIDVKYRTSTKANETDYAWAFFTRDVAVTRAVDDDASGVSINKKTFFSDYVTLNINLGTELVWGQEALMSNSDGIVPSIAPGNSIEDILALQATPNEGNIDEIIVSDYQAIHAVEIKDFAVYTTTTPKALHPEELTVAKAVAAANRIELVYNENTSTLELAPLVSTWNQAGTLEVGGTILNVDAPVYTYYAESVEGDDDVTEQNAYVTVDETTGTLTIKTFTTSAIGKEPIIKVVSTLNDVELACAYLPIVIVETPTLSRPAFVHMAPNTAKIYRTLPNDHTGAYTSVLNWDEMSQMYDAISAGAVNNIAYTDLNFTQELFNTNYKVGEFKINGLNTVTDFSSDPITTLATGEINVVKDVRTALIPSTFASQTNDNAINIEATVTPQTIGTGTQNASITYSVSNQAYLGEYNVSVVYTLKNSDNSSILPPTITVEFGITVEETAPVLAYNTSIMTDATGDNWGKYVGGSVAHYKAQQSIKELFDGHLETGDYVGVTNHVKNFASLDFDVTDENSKFDVFNKEASLVATDASAIDNKYLDEEIGLKSGNRLDVVSLDVPLQAFYQLDNGEVLEGQVFTVTFNNPFELQIPTVELNHLPASGGSANTDKQLVDMNIVSIKSGLSPQAKFTSNNDIADYILSFTDAKYVGVDVFQFSKTDFAVDYSTAITDKVGEFGANLNTSIATGGADNNESLVIGWTYQGGTYIQDLTAKTKVSVEIGEDFEVTQSIDIIVKKNN